MGRKKRDLLVAGTLRYYQQFDEFIATRKDDGVTPEDAARLITEISLSDSSMTPMTADDVLALEKDPYHGLDPKAVSYLRLWHRDVRIMKVEGMQSSVSVMSRRVIKRKALAMTDVARLGRKVPGLRLTYYDIDNNPQDIWVETPSFDVEYKALLEMLARIADRNIARSLSAPKNRKRAKGWMDWHPDRKQD